jgi:hypothetical protein
MRRQKKYWRVPRQHWCHSLGLDSFFQKTLIYYQKKTPFSQEMHLKIPLLSQSLKFSNLEPGLESQPFTCLWNKYHQWLSDVQLIQMIGFSSFRYISEYTCFTAGKGIGVWGCHASHGHWKPIIVTSIVHRNEFVYKCLFQRTKVILFV